MNNNDKIIIREMKIDDILEIKNLELPNFQRTLKWKNNLRQDLIYSIKSGYPIGVFTLFSNEDKLYIIDGLQRFSTLKIFLSRPQEIFSWLKLRKEEFFCQVFDEILAKYPTEEKKIIRGVKAWYENDFDQKKNSFMNFYTKYFYDTSLDLVELENVYLSLRKIFSISEMSAPVITYKGNWNEAAEIFERMNTGSVNLSKYEIYAAMWSEKKIANFPEDYTDLLVEKYSELNDLITTDKTGDSIFDLLLGASLKLNKIKGIENIFPNLKKVKSTNKSISFERDELGFEIISTLIYGNPLKIYDVIEVKYADVKINELADYILALVPKIENAILYLIDQNKKYDLYYEALFFTNVVYKSKYLPDKIPLHIWKENYSGLNDTILYLEELSRKNNWFRDDNRQVSFLQKVNKTVDSYYSKNRHHNKEELDTLFL